MDDLDVTITHTPFILNIEVVNTVIASISDSGCSRREWEQKYTYY